MNLTNIYAYSDPTANEAISNVMREANAQRRKQREQENNKKAEARWIKSQQTRKRKQRTENKNRIGRTYN